MEVVNGKDKMYISHFSKEFIVEEGGALLMYILGWITGACVGLIVGMVIGMYSMMLVHRNRMRNALCPDTGMVNAPDPDTLHSRVDDSANLR